MCKHPWGANVGAETNYPPGGCLACADRLSRTLRRVGSCAEIITLPTSHHLGVLRICLTGASYYCCFCARYELRTHQHKRFRYVHTAFPVAQMLPAGPPRVATDTPTSPQSSGPDGSSRVRVKIWRAQDTVACASTTSTARQATRGVVDVELLLQGPP